MGVALHDRSGLIGILRGWDRPRGSRIWRPVGTFRNIVLNPFYIDLFNVMAGGPSPASLLVGALALGYGNGPTFARIDAGNAVPGTNPLKAEWNNPVVTLNAQLNNATAYTSAVITATPVLLPTATTIQLGSGQVVTLSAQTAAGGTSITFTSITTTQQYNVGTALNVTSWTPQRMAPTLTTALNTDPPQMTFSFYLAASANIVNLQFTEAALMYNTPSLVAGGSGSWLSHVAFSYLKAPNTDLRLDYILARSLT